MEINLYIDFFHCFKVSKDLSSILTKRDVDEKIEPSKIFKKMPGLILIRFLSYYFTWSNNEFQIMFVQSFTNYLINAIVFTKKAGL